MNIDETIKILLVDDDSLIRQRLRTLLSNVEEFEVVGEAENGKTAMELTRKLMPDIVIMDIDIPVTNGIEATRWIGFVCADIKVISYTALENEIRMMAEFGASDFLYRFCRDNEIVSTIKSLYESQMQPG